MTTATKAIIGAVSLTDTLVLKNLTLAGSEYDIADCFNGDAGSVITGSYNLIGFSQPGILPPGTDGNIQVKYNNGVSALGSYGGPTQTVALLPGSPAIGVGTAVQGVSTDQRGEPLDSPRPDIGAFQSQGFTLSLVPGSTPQSTGVGTPFANPLAVTVTANNPLEPVAGGILAFTAPSTGASASSPLRLLRLGRVEPPRSTPQPIRLLAPTRSRPRLAVPPQASTLSSPTALSP